MTQQPIRDTNRMISFHAATPRTVASPAHRSAASSPHRLAATVSGLKARVKCLLAVTVLATSAPLPAQSGTSSSQDSFTLQQLTDQGKAMLEQARTTTGSVSKPIAQWHGHNALINARTRSGGAELHATFSDIFIVLSGEGTELTGGTVVDPKPIGNETRGARLEGASVHPLHTGDILHIAAGTPHQALEDPGQGIVLLVLKIEDSPVTTK